MRKGIHPKRIYQKGFDRTNLLMTAGVFFDTSLCRVGSRTKKDPDQVLGQRIFSMVLLYIIQEKAAVSHSEKYSHPTQSHCFLTAQVSVLAHEGACVLFTYITRLHNNLLKRCLLPSWLVCRPRNMDIFQSCLFRLPCRKLASQGVNLCFKAICPTLLHLRHCFSGRSNKSCSKVTRSGHLALTLKYYKAR